MHIRKIRNHAISAAATLAITWTAAFSAFAATLSPTTAHDDIPGDATLKEIVEGAGAAEALEAEAKERKTADAALQTNVTANATAISTETTARKDADAALVSGLSDLSDALTTETKSRIDADSSNAKAVDDEATARENADKTLQGNIDAVSSALSAHVSTRSGNPHGVTAADVKVSLVPQTEVAEAATTNEAGEVVTTVTTNATGKATVSVGDDSAEFYTAAAMDEAAKAVSAKIAAIPVAKVENGVVSVDGEKSAALDAGEGRTVRAVNVPRKDVQWGSSTNYWKTTDGVWMSGDNGWAFTSTNVTNSSIVGLQAVGHEGDDPVQTNGYTSVLYPDGGRVLTTKMLAMSKRDTGVKNADNARVANFAGSTWWMFPADINYDMARLDEILFQEITNIYGCVWMATADTDNPESNRWFNAAERSLAQSPLAVQMPVLTYEEKFDQEYGAYLECTGDESRVSYLIPDGTDFVTKKTLDAATKNAVTHDESGTVSVDGSLSAVDITVGGIIANAITATTISVSSIMTTAGLDIEAAIKTEISDRETGDAATLSAATNAANAYTDEAVKSATPANYAAVSNAAMTALQPAATNGLVTASVTNGLASAASVKANAAALSAHASDTNNPHNVTAAQLGALTAESDPVFAAWTNNTSIVAGKGAFANANFTIAIGEMATATDESAVSIGNIASSSAKSHGAATFNIVSPDPSFFYFGAAEYDLSGAAITPRTLQSYLDERAKRYALVASSSASISAADGNLYALVADTNGVAVTLPTALADYAQDFVLRVVAADTNGTYLAEISNLTANVDFPMGDIREPGSLTGTNYVTFTQTTKDTWSIGYFAANKEE